MVIFNSYVKLPEGTVNGCAKTGIDPSPTSNLRWSTHATCVLLYSPRRYQEFLIVGILLSPTNGLMTIPHIPCADGGI
jgi:hypothetical protein